MHETAWGVVSSSNISSGLWCHTDVFATSESPQVRLCTETKKMMWQLRLLQILTFKNAIKFKSMVGKITNRGHDLRSQEIFLGFFVYPKFALLES